MDQPESLVFYLVDGFQPLDLFGPLEAFAAANQESASPFYTWSIVSAGGDAKISESGIRLLPDAPLDTVETCSTLFLVGGAGPRRHVYADEERAALQRLVADARRVASVCTGSFLLAQLGLLDGQEATTHWRHADTLATQYPAISVDADALYRRAGRVWTSAGVTSGIDMALAMIAEDHGPVAAMGAARELVVYLHRTGGQSQFSEALQLQAPDTGRLVDLFAWISTHLNEDLSVPKLAEQFGASERNFRRLVQQATGMAPSVLVERLRLDHARSLLSAGAARISSVAAAVGFQRADTFARAFERTYGIAPSAFAARFAADHHRSRNIEGKSE